MKSKKLTITCESPLQGAACKIFDELPTGAYKVIVLEGEFKGQRTTVLPEQGQILEEQDSEEKG